MKRLFAIGLVLAATAGLSAAAMAMSLDWPTNTGWRVDAMGDAWLAIEDETTAINPFNHGNTAGVALIGKMNRLDAGLSYVSNNYKLTDDSTPGVTVESKYDVTDMELTNPGGEYRGLIYWLDDNFVVRAGVEGMLINTTQSLAITGLDTDEEKVNFQGIGVGASGAYLLDMGLAIGAGVSYKSAVGKPDPLPAGLDKAEFSASNLSWGIGAAMNLDAGDDLGLTFGLNVGANDEMPDIAGFVSGGLADPGDYSVTIKTEATDYSNTTELTSTPLLVSGEAILNLGSMLELGVMIDYLSRTLDYSEEETIAGVTTSDSFKAGDQSSLGLTPIGRAYLPVGEDMTLVPGAFLSTFGTGTQNSYYPTGEKQQTVDYGVTRYGVGLGLQAMGKQLQIGVQYDGGATTMDSTSYAPSGATLGTGTGEGSTSNIRLGAEFWAVPILAIRAGFGMLSDITKDGYFNTTSGEFEDLKNNTSRISLGLGLALPEGMTTDLLVVLDTYTQDPPDDPEPTNTSTGIYLGAKLPL